MLLAFSTTVVTRWGRPWFTISLGIIVGVMMVSYVAVPARLIGVEAQQSRRDKLSTSVVGGALSATVCTPPYVLGRLGILMLGSSVLLHPRDLRARAGSHAASRRDRGGQGDQDERDAHGRRPPRPHAARSTRGAPGSRAITPRVNLAGALVDPNGLRASVVLVAGVSKRIAAERASGFGDQHRDAPTLPGRPALGATRAH